MKNPRNTRISVQLDARTVAVALGAIASVWLLIQLWPILLVIASALMIVGMINPIVERLEKRGLRRSWSVGVCFLAMFVVLGGLAFITIPSLASQAMNIGERLPTVQIEAADWLSRSKLGAPFAHGVRDLKASELVTSAEKLGLAYSARAAEVAAYAVSAVFLGIYFLLDRDRLRGSLFAFVPRPYHLRLSRILLELETIVGGYMRGQIFTSALMTVFTFAVLSIAGVPNPVALAVFAGVADVLPYVGALLACGPAFLAALERGPTTALVVLAILAVYQEVESRLIVPRIYGRVLRLPAATVMIALLVGGKLLGILGALLALPIAAAIRMIIVELRVDLPGEEPASPSLVARDAAAEAEFERRAAHVPAVQAAAIANEIALEREHETPVVATMAPGETP